MIKPVKRNKRLNWSESRYGVQFRIKFFKRFMAAVIASQGTVKRQSIRLSIDALNARQTMKAVSEAMK